MNVPPIEPGSDPPEAESLPESFPATAPSPDEAESPAEEAFEDAGEEPLAEEPARPPLLVRAWRSVSGVLFGLVTVFLAIVIAELLREPMALVTAFVQARFTSIRNGLIAAVALGAVLFVASYAYLIRQGARLDADDFSDMLRRVRESGGDPSGWRRLRSLERRRGGSFAVEISFAQAKEVIRLPGWWREPLWASVVAGLAGGLILVFGGLSFFLLYGPPWLKVLMGGWMLYGLVRSAWGLYKA